MIIYDLVCDNAHRFEGWFSNCDDYDQQLKDGMLLCPVCHSENVRKLPSASYINTRSATTDHSPAPEPDPDPEANVPAPDALQLVEAVKKILHETLVKGQFDNVGDQFADEVRKIHHGESEERNVFGSATEHEIAELSEEGIETFAIPVLPDKKKLN